MNENFLSLLLCDIFNLICGLFGCGLVLSLLNAFEYVFVEKLLFFATILLKKIKNA